MGMWSKSTLAFGIDLGEDIPDLLYLSEIGDDEGRDEEFKNKESDIANFFDSWKESKGEEFEFPFEILTYGDYNHLNYFLAYDQSIQHGYSINPKIVKFIEIDVEKIKKMIEKNGFGESGNISPNWCMLSFYG